MSSGGVADIVPGGAGEQPGPAPGPPAQAPARPELPGGPEGTRHPGADGPDRDAPATGATRSRGGDGDDRRADRRWLWALLAVCALGLGIRIAYVFGWQDFDSVGGDAYYYHASANLLADGKGFAHPYFADEGITAPGADHPPGYQMVLAVPSLLGFDSIRDHQVFSCLLGAVTVGLAGVAGRQIAGRRAGLIAAGITAVYPNIWMNDAALMSETLALLFGVLVVIAAYAAWDRPDGRRFALVGVAVGLATLARAEAVMLIPLLLWPLAAWARHLGGWRPRVGRAAAASGTALAVMAPWVVANMVRFEEPTTLSTQMGPTLDVANCDPTYYGPVLGGWSFDCASDPEANGDRSTIDKELRDEAVSYARDHLDRLPVVVLARLGRTAAVYQPLDQLNFDRFAENRPLGASRAGLAGYYLVAVGAVAGAVVLRRRGVPSFPLVAGVANVAITVVLFYGSTRFRAPAEPSLVLLTAVAVDAGLRWLRGGAVARPGTGSDDAPRPAATG